MLCLVILISTIHCITKIISTPCDMSEDLRDEIPWFRISLLSHLCQQDRKKQFITNLSSENIH